MESIAKSTISSFSSGTIYARFRFTSGSGGLTSTGVTCTFTNGGVTDEVDDFWTLEPQYTEIPSVMYSDISVTYDTETMGIIAVGVTNFLDEEVPFVPSAFNAPVETLKASRFAAVKSASLY